MLKGKKSSAMQLCCYTLQMDQGKWLDPCPGHIRGGKGPGTHWISQIVP